MPRNYKDNSLYSTTRERPRTYRSRGSLIRNGHSSISADMAVRLGLLFGTTPELWLGMQTSSDLRVEPQKPQHKVKAIAS